MSDLHPDVVIERCGEEASLWGAHVGRGLSLGVASLGPDRPPAVTARLRRLGFLQDVSLGSLVVCRHRAAPRIDGALWAPRADRVGPGGPDYRAMALDPVEQRLFDAINDRRTLNEVAARAGLDAAEAAGRLRRFSAADVQAVQLRDAAPPSRDAGLRRLWGALRAPAARPADRYGPDGATTLVDYHVDGIRDAAEQFDHRETTVAHALALPHPGLAGRPYGLALREALGHAGAVVEVGCGTGELAAAWLSGGEVRYLRVDLSPALLAAQASAAPSSACVLADATRLPLRDASVPFLLSNEVLADLRAVPVPDPPGPGPWVAYGLRPTGWANVGAWSFVAEIARVLAPGGRAVLTEFGDVDRAPEEAVQLDHPEVSIHFGELAEVARQHGLSARVEPLAQLLGVDLGAAQLARHSWWAVRAWAASVGRRLPARAWTPSQLPVEATMDGLDWTTLADEGPGPLITRFWALHLSKA